VTPSLVTPLVSEWSLRYIQHIRSHFRCEFFRCIARMLTTKLKTAKRKTRLREVRTAHMLVHFVHNCGIIYMQERLQMAEQRQTASVLCPGGGLTTTKGEYS